MQNQLPRVRHGINERRLLQEIFAHYDGFEELATDLADTEVVRDKQLLDPDAAADEATRDVGSHRLRLPDGLVELPPEQQS